MKSKFINIKGITLIALIVTIIVLLILAGVTVATLTGENGLLAKAQLAKEKNIEAEQDEKDKLSSYENELNNWARAGETYSVTDSGIATVLWINQNPTQSFAAQSVSISGTDYDEYEVEYLLDTSSTQTLTTRFSKGYGSRMTWSGGTTGTFTGSVVAFNREITSSSDTQITFGVGGYLSSGSKDGNSPDNIRCIPYKIKGYKVKALTSN